MLAASTAFNEAFKSDLREVKMWIKINDVAYTDEDIVSFNFTSGSITGDSFAIGSTFANSVKLTLCKVVEGLKVFDTVLPEMGIILEDGSVEYVKLGTFLITEEVNPDRNENRTSIECTDQMITLDDPYVSKLKYPAKIRDVALEIANLAGVAVDKVSFGRLMDNTIREPEGYSFREAIGLIAQFEAGYATFDRNGLLAVKTLYDPQYKITPDEYFLKGLVKNELMFRPAGVEVKVGDDEAKNLSIGNKKGSVIHLENKVMTERLLRLVYEKIRNINYYPYSLNWRGNPAIEAGDWLYIKDTKGNEYKLPNLNYTMEYKGGLTAVSTVDTVASNEVKFKYRKILDQAIEYVNNSIKDIDGSMNYYGAEEPSNPKSGDIWFKYVGSDTEIWIYQKVGELDKFEWVLQISSAVDETIKEMIDELEKESKENQEQVQNALSEAEKARKEAELARTEAFDSNIIAKQAEKDSLTAIAQGNQNTAEITKLDDSIKLQATNVEGNTAKIAKLQIENDKVSSTVSKTQADLDGLSAGTTNLISNATTDMHMRTNFVLGTGTKSLIDYSSPEKKALQIKVLTKTGIYMWYWSGFKSASVKKLLKGQPYTLSFIISSEREGYLGSTGINEATINKFNLGKTTTEARMMSITFTPIVDSDKSADMNVHIYSKSEYDAINLNNTFTIHSFMLSEGSIPNGFNFAIQDMTTKSEFSTFEQTVKGFQTSVNSDLAGVKSEQTQMAGQITSVVRTQQDLDTEEKVLNSNFENDELNQAPRFWDTANGTRAKVVENSDKVNGDNKSEKVLRVNGSKELHINIVSDLIKIVGGSTYKTGMRVRWMGPSNAGGTIHYTLQFLDINKNILLTTNAISDTSITAWRKIRGNDVKAPSNAVYAKIWINNKFNPDAVWVDDISLQRVITSEDTNSSIATLTQITQLQDQINLNVKKTETIDGTVTKQQGQINVLSNNIDLKVDKNNVVAQINLSPETIRLDAKRIHLAGTSLIDSAVIKESHIADAAITTAKIQDATISNAKIISIDANKVNANTLSAITTNTGQLNVTGWLDFQTENRGLRGSYNFYDVPDESYYSRWYDGELRLSHRHMILTSNIYNVNANSTRGSFKYYSETMYGPDYVKLRQYKNDKKSILSRVDIRADAIEIGEDWSFAKSIVLRNNGTAVFGGKVDFNGGVDISLGLRVGRIESPMNYQSFVINEGRNLGTMIFGHDGQRFIRSMDIYDRTYNSQPQVCVTDAGTLGRIVSAKKYKRDILVATDLFDKAKNILSIQPKSWYDKNLSSNQRHYGFVADDFEENGLPEVVLYGRDREVEGLSYDRISMYHNIVLVEHEKEINLLKEKILILEERLADAG